MTIGVRRPLISADRAGDRLGHAALLGRRARIGAAGVDERDDRQVEALGQPEQAHRLAVPLGVRHAEVAADVLVRLGAALVSDEHERVAGHPRQAGHDRGVVAEEPVTVELHDVGGHGTDELERVRPLDVAGRWTRAHARSCAAASGGCDDADTARRRQSPAAAAAEPGRAPRVRRHGSRRLRWHRRSGCVRPAIRGQQPPGRGRGRRPRTVAVAGPRDGRRSPRTACAPSAVRAAPAGLEHRQVGQLEFRNPNGRKPAAPVARGACGEGPGGQRRAGTRRPFPQVAQDRGQLVAQPVARAPPDPGTRARAGTRLAGSRAAARRRSSRW